MLKSSTRMETVSQTTLTKMMTGMAFQMTKVSLTRMETASQTTLIKMMTRMAFRMTKVPTKDTKTLTDTEKQFMSDTDCVPHREAT